MKTQDYALFLPFFMGKDILASRKFLANSYGSVALYESVPICGACHYLYNLYNSKVETAYSLSGAQDIIVIRFFIYFLAERISISTYKKHSD
jgi:hypothetical protein